MKSATSYIDGASRGNPGPAGIGVIIAIDDKVKTKISEFIGKTTNNEAEYRALIKALQTAITLGVKRLRVYSDSELLVKQIRGEYSVKDSNLATLYRKAMELITNFEEFNIEHVGREFNHEADKLANEAIERTTLDV